MTGAVHGDESVPSHGGSEEDQVGGTGNLTPQASAPAVPRCEGRQAEAKPIGENGAEGGVKPVESPSRKAPPPESTPAGATVSPGDEHPAEKQSETDVGDD